jgi:hypothetical protein
MIIVEQYASAENTEAFLRPQVCLQKQVGHTHASSESGEHQPLPSPGRNITTKMASASRPPSSPRTNLTKSRNPVPTAVSIASIELICDYDKDATPLYSLLETSKWDMAIERCNTNPNEVKTWIVRHDKSSPSVIRWKLLPLHAAVMFLSPISVVTALLDKYPVAASKCDDQGMLPLHLAFRHKKADEPLLELLLLQYPKAVHATDRRDRVPLEHGREGVFSAKLMRLYADSAVFSANATMIDIANMDDTVERKLSNQQRCLGEQMNALKIAYEEQIDRMIKEHATEKSMLIQQLASQKMAAMTQPLELERENAELRTVLEQTQADRDMLDIVLKGTKAFNEEATKQLREIIKEQQEMQTMVHQQKEAMDAAQAKRDELINTFFQTEGQLQIEQTSQSMAMVEHAEALRARMATLLARAPPSANQEYLDAHRHSDDISAITEYSG